MTVKICIGSACHLKGSYEVISMLKALMQARQVNADVKLMSCFCMGACGEGVSVQVDDGEIVNILPETTQDFFEKYILGK